MRILTFNHHESYLCSLSALGHEFDVVVKKGALDLSWSPTARPKPANFRLVPFDARVKADLARGAYDAVICHTAKNLAWLFPYVRPRYVFVAHIPLFHDTWANRLKAFAKKALYRAFAATHRVRFFAVSHFKYDSWGIPGSVAVLTPEPLPSVLGQPVEPKALMICNQILNRRGELGYAMVEELAGRFPLVTVGNNPGHPGNVLPRDHADFTRIVAGFRIYLYTIRHPYGDGYNTALLEAMQMGMAVVTVPNPTSPIVHGVNGLVGDTADEIEAHVRRLFADPAEVERLGRAAQETVRAKFAKEAFLAAWRRLLEA